MTIDQQIREIVADQLGRASLEIGWRDSLTDKDMGDLDRVEIVITIEDTFGIEIDDSVMNTFDTVTDLARVVEGRFDGAA